MGTKEMLKEMPWKHLSQNACCYFRRQGKALNSTADQHSSIHEKGGEKLIPRHCIRTDCTVGTGEEPKSTMQTINLFCLHFCENTSQDSVRISDFR